MLEAGQRCFFPSKFFPVPFPQTGRMNGNPKQHQCDKRVGFFWVCTWLKELIPSLQEVFRLRTWSHLNVAFLKPEGDSFDVPLN